MNSICCFDFLGKSTLVPALLIAEGYDKVIVTQPRRLPCMEICERVNQTIELDMTTSEKKIAGWAVSRDEENANADILYLTDGLLKEFLLYNEHFLSKHTELDKSVVFIIDEVHERSVNIDICLALLARSLTVDPALKPRMKILISSATLDQSVPRLFRQLPNIDFAEFEMARIIPPFRVKNVLRLDENILEVVQELHKKRQRNDQILCFVNSASEVFQCCHRILKMAVSSFRQRLPKLHFEICRFIIPSRNGPSWNEFEQLNQPSDNVEVGWAELAMENIIICTIFQ